MATTTKKILIGGQALRELGSDRHTADRDYAVVGSGATWKTETAEGEVLDFAAHAFTKAVWAAMTPVEIGAELVADAHVVATEMSTATGVATGQVLLGDLGVVGVDPGASQALVDDEVIELGIDREPVDGDILGVRRTAGTPAWSGRHIPPRHRLGAVCGVDAGSTRRFGCIRARISRWAAHRPTAAAARDQVRATRRAARP